MEQTHCRKMLANEIYIKDDDDAAVCRQKVLVFHIAGNPGLITYYKKFLLRTQQALKEHFTATGIKASVDVYGQSLAGFEVGSGFERRATCLASGTQAPPYGLKTLIDIAEQTLSNLVAITEKQPGSAPVVVITGHSVGAYIALELLTRLQKRHERRRWRIACVVCLFPTIVDIAESKMGRRLSVCDRERFQLNPFFITVCLLVQG